MKRAATITIGVVLTTLISGCSDEPHESDFSEVCVDQNMTIFPEKECEVDNNGSHHFIYIPGSTHVGAHGSTYKGTHSSVRPTTGTIGRVPPSGGFGLLGGGGG